MKSSSQLGLTGISDWSFEVWGVYSGHFQLKGIIISIATFLHLFDAVPDNLLTECTPGCTMSVILPVTLKRRELKQVLTYFTGKAIIAGKATSPHKKEVVGIKTQ